MNQCWIQVSAGKGPKECSLAVRLTLEKLMKEAKNMDCVVDILEFSGEPNLKAIDSVLLSVKGLSVSQLIQNWSGTIQWNCVSPFRPTHKRKNWFIAIHTLTVPTFNDTTINEKDVVFEAMRASGPGGQHVNKTDSAIRATHIKSGIVVTAREERSQLMNKKLALARIASALKEQKNIAIASQEQLRWELHQQLERGNPKRIFQGLNFEEKI
jgi:peptide chain release factor